MRFPVHLLQTQFDGPAHSLLVDEGIAAEHDVLEFEREMTLIIYGEFAAAIWALANLLLKKREKAAATFPPQIRHHLPYPR